MKKTNLWILLVSVILIAVCTSALTACGASSGGNGTSNTGSGTTVGTTGNDATVGGETAPATPTKLATPTVSVDGAGLVNWTDVAHASGYVIDVGGTQFNYTQAVSLMNGETVKVKAVGDGTKYSDSDWSNAVTYRAPVPKLSTPAPYFAEGSIGILRWAAVTGAQSYKVHWYSTSWSDAEKKSTRDNQLFCAVVTTNEFCATDQIGATSLEYYEFEVQAIGDGADYTDGSWSLPIGFSIREVGAIPTLHFANEQGLATWEPVPGAEEYLVTEYSLDGGYIAEHVLPADQTTFQMTANTFIRVSAGRWFDASDALYLIPDSDLGYYLTYADEKWRFRLAPDYNDGSLVNYGAMEYRVNGGEIRSFDSLGVFDLHAGDVIELRRANAGNNWQSVTVAACEHTEYRFYPLVLPTETASGHRAYYQCVDCGATWEFGLDFLKAYSQEYPANNYNLPIAYDEYSDYLSMKTAMDYVFDAEASDDYKTVYKDMFLPLVHSEETEWLYDAEEHWGITYCRNCGEYEIGQTKAAHAMDGGVCTVCGYRADELLPEDVKLEECYSYNGVVIINAYYAKEYDPAPYVDEYQSDNGTPGLADYIVLYEGANAVFNDKPAEYMRGWESWGDDQGNGGSYFNYEALYKHTDKCGYPFHAVLTIDPHKNSTLPGGLLALKDISRASTSRITVISRNGKVLVFDAANYAAGVDSIEIVPGQEIAVGATAPVDYNMTPRKDVLGTLTWTSSDESILIVDEAGNMTALKEGTVTVRVETNPFNTYTDFAGYLQQYGVALVSEATVTVKAELLPEALTARDEVTMTTKNPYPMAVSFFPAGSLASLVYTSSDETVATVNADGLVTAHKAGTTEITATSSNGLTATTLVTVQVYDLIEKTRLDYTLTDYFNSISSDHTPLEGDIHLLVLPVRFPESNEYYNYDQVKADLEVAFFGSKDYNGYDTVKSFYETESCGKLTVSGTVADWYDAPSYKGLTSANRTDPFDTSYGIADLACWAVAQYRAANAVDGVEPTLDEYDYDDDGVLDGVIVIYAFPSRGEYVNVDEDDLTKAPDVFWPAVWSFRNYSTFSGSADPARPVVGKRVMFASPAWMYGAPFTYDDVWTEEGYTVDSYTSWGDAFSTELSSEGWVSVTTGGETGFYWAYDSTVTKRTNPKVDGLIDGESRLGKSDDNNVVAETHGSGYHRYVDPRVFIHEMGHMFGINDYYDTTVHDEQTGLTVTQSYIDGGFNMQDENVGAHDPYSMLLFGWIDPYIITDECTIEINPIASSGDVILLSATGLAGNSPFDEYLLIELYTPTGLNEFDSNEYDPLYALQGPQTAGCRIWHVDARLVDRVGQIVENGVITDGDAVRFATSNTWQYGDYPDLYELMLLRKNAAEDEDAYWMQHVLANGGSIDGDIFKRQEIAKVLMKMLEWENAEYVEYANNSYPTTVDEIILALGQDALEAALHTPYIDWSTVDSVAALDSFLRAYSWELFCRLLESVDIDPDADWSDVLSALSEQGIDQIVGNTAYGKKVLDWNFRVSNYATREALRTMLEENASQLIGRWLTANGYDETADLTEVCMSLGAPLLNEELNKVREKNVYESAFSSDNLFVTGDTFDMTRYAKAFYNEGLMDSGEELGWAISFDYVDAERAIITFTRTN